MCLLTNERYITYQTGFLCQGWDLGVTWGLGAKNFFFRNSTRFDVLVSDMNCTCTCTIFLGPQPLGPWGGVLLVVCYGVNTGPLIRLVNFRLLDR